MNTITKHCSKCGQTKPVSEFNKDRRRPDGLDAHCRACRKIWYYKDEHGKNWAKQNYWKDPQKARKRTRQFLIDHPDKGKQYRDKHYAKCHEKCLQASAKTRQGYRDDAFNAYGGYICACCGENNPKFMTIDHINNITSQDHKAPRSGWTFYHWLKKQGYPPGYQVLCYNCNLGRARNQGICPHKE